MRFFYLYCLLLHAGLEAFFEATKPALVPLVLVHCTATVEPSNKGTIDPILFFGYRSATAVDLIKIL